MDELTKLILVVVLFIFVGAFTILWGYKAYQEQKLKKELEELDKISIKK